MPFFVSYFLELLYSILKRIWKNSLETRSFSETSRSRDETESSHLRDRGCEKSRLETVSRPRHVSIHYSSAGKQQIKEVRRKIIGKTWKQRQLLSESGFVLRIAPPPLSRNRRINMKKSSSSAFDSSVILS